MKLTKAQEIEVIEKCIEIYDGYDEDTFNCISNKEENSLCLTLSDIGYELDLWEDLDGPCLTFFIKPKNAYGLWWWKVDDLKSRKEYLQMILKKTQKL